MLTGTEVKRLRPGRASLIDGYANDQGRRGVAARRAHPGVHRGHLEQPHPAPRPQAAAAPRRDRPADRQDPRGRPDLIPLSLYFKDGKAKVEIALARARRSTTSGSTIAERDANREIQRAHSAARERHERLRCRHNCIGGERFRLRTSRQVKRAEETRGDLVNHPLEQKYKRRQQRARSRCLTGSRAVSLRVLPLQGLASLGGLPLTAAAVVSGTTNSSYDLAGRPV